MGQRTKLSTAAMVTAAVTASAAATAWAGNVVVTQQTLVHTNQITLGAEFSETSGYGDFPLSLAFDGANAYLGGWNNGSGFVSTIGVVKVLNVTTATPSTQPLANTLISAPDLRGYDALAYDSASDSLFTFHDSGVFLTSLISRRNASDGSEVWTTVSPVGQRVMAGAIDPTGDAGSPAVAFLAQGQGRRLALKVSDGSVLYDASGGVNPGGIILGQKNGTDDFGTAWRGLTFDSQGNIAVSEQDFVGYGVRIGDNRWQNLDANNDRTSKSVEKDVAANLVGQGVAILEGLGDGGANLLAFTGRNMTQATDLFAGTTAVADTAVHLRNLNGTTIGLSQITLTGSEDGIGADWQNDAKNLAFGLDQNGVPTLLVLDFVERRLDVYQVVAAGLEGDLNHDGFVGLDDLDLVLTHWNLSVTPGDPLMGDPSGDGFVGLEDLDTVLVNWNNGTPPAGSAVPEPATLALLGLGAAAAIRRRR